MRKASREIARVYTAIGLKSLNIKGMGASARGRGHGGVAAKQALNRRIRAGLWGFTQHAIASAMEAAAALALKLPAMDSSRTDAGCGHVDAESRKGKAFRCTACGRVDDADVNAARVMRQRALRWLGLKSAGHSDREATEMLWKELRTARRESRRLGADRAEATIKPACAGETFRFHPKSSASTDYPRVGGRSSACSLTGPVSRPKSKSMDRSISAPRSSHDRVIGRCESRAALSTGLRYGVQDIGGAIAAGTWFCPRL